MNKLLITASLLTLFASTPTQAEKPSWAGQGGKPSKAEREMHKDAMTSKGSAKNNTKSMQQKDERDMNDLKDEADHIQRQSSVENVHDAKDEADRMQRQSPVENVHEAVHDAAQAHETAETLKKWYEFWRK